VQRANAKLVLVGDHGQLPEIGAGGAFRGLLTRVPVIELTENRRQAAAWEREALTLVRRGSAGEAVGAYDTHERIVAGEDAAQLRQRVVAEWWAAGDLDGAMMIAHRRVDVGDLNRRAHAVMLAGGMLDGESLKTAAGDVCVGERVVLRRNDAALNVINGDRGTVVGIQRQTGEVSVALGDRRVTLGPDYLERPDRHGRPTLEYGYAITGHLAQGMTCRRTFVLASDQLSREWAYVALSRGTRSNRLHVLEGDARERLEYAPGRDRSAGLVERLMRSEAQRLATDHERDRQQLAWIARELADAERARSDALAARRRLARTNPPWYRSAARREHADASAAASEALALATERVDALRERQAAELQAERARSVRVERMPAGRRAIGRER
jgi:ATP-dependent exoDNAse (exonuclease V) alpha subunit